MKLKSFTGVLIFAFGISIQSAEGQNLNITDYYVEQIRLPKKERSLRDISESIPQHDLRLGNTLPPTPSGMLAIEDDSLETKDKRKEVYKINPWINYPIITAGLVTNYLGLKVLKGKKGLDSARVVRLTPEDVNNFDRVAARQNPSKSETYMKTSDYVMIGTFMLPAALLADDDIRRDALKLGVIFLTTGTIMANAYSWGVGHIDKYRPYVYNPDEDIKRRTRNGSRNSFYGGHAAAAASASFLGAKFYHDYNPGSNLTPWLFAAAIIPPSIVGYYRVKAGMHFPTDIIAGIPAGAAIGILVPHLHKVSKKNKNFSFEPVMGYYNGYTVTYRWK